MWAWRSLLRRTDIAPVLGLASARGTGLKIIQILIRIYNNNKIGLDVSLLCCNVTVSSSSRLLYNFNVIFCLVHSRGGPIALVQFTGDYSARYSMEGPPVAASVVTIQGQAQESCNPLRTFA